MEDSSQKLTDKIIMDSKASSPPRPVKKEDENQGSPVSESPSRASRPPIPSTPGGMVMKPPSTPRQAVYGFAPGTPIASQNYGQTNQGSSKIMAELNTPVISNANVTYVDDEPQGGRMGAERGAHPNLGLPTGRAFGIDKSTSYGIPKSLAPRSNITRPQPFLRQQQGTMGVMSSLAMPSAFYSDDSSLDEDVAKVEGNQGNPSGPASSILRPVELKPNTRFHSFQGSSQYGRSIPKGTVRPMSALSPAREETVGLGNTYTLPGQQHQYLPTVRGAHGVKELSDNKDLNAIFKADRKTSTGTSNVHHKSPKIVSPMSVDNDSEDEDEDEDEEQHQEPSFPQLQGSIPIDDRQWSIPSIRLANHVNTFGMDGSIHSYHTLSDEEDYTDDGGSSLDGSYIDGDDDDVSLSSKESFDQVRRWRRMSGALRRGMSGDGRVTETPVAATTKDDEDVDMVPPPHLMRTSPTSNLNAVAMKEGMMYGTTQEATSLLEQRFGQINIDPMDSNINSIYCPPSILNITAPPQSIDDNAFDYHKDENGKHIGARPTKPRRRHKKKGRSKSHSAAAFEWINQLQQNAVEGGLITEAASSKFLTGHKGQTECADYTAQQNVTKALGMPHPLCRSSTIEAGGFAYGISGGVGSS